MGETPEQSPANPHDPQGHEAIGVFHGETFDWPITQIMEEQTSESGRKMVRAKYLSSAGQTDKLEENEAWLPADSLEMQTKETAPGAETDDPATEEAKNESFAYLEGLRQAVTKSEAKTAELETALQEAKAKAKDLIDSNDFDKASSGLQEAKTLRKQLKNEKGKLHHVQTQLQRVEDLISPANILDLKQAFDDQLGKERDRRNRLHDDQTLDDYADLLRENLINKYLQTGADPEKPRHYPLALMVQIKKLMAESYEELEARLPKIEVNPRDVPVRKRDQLFQSGQPVQVIRGGRLEPEWKVSGYDGYTPYWDPVVEVSSADDKDKILEPQQKLENWQKAPVDYGVAKPEPGRPTAVRPESEAPKASEDQAGDVPEATPEITTSAGLWDKWFGARRELEQIQKRWGRRANAVRNLGNRMLLGRRPPDYPEIPGNPKNA